MEIKRRTIGLSGGNIAIMDGPVLQVLVGSEGLYGPFRDEVEERHAESKSMTSSCLSYSEETACWGEIGSWLDVDLGLKCPI